MNKYDWSNVPIDIMWIATDGDGVVNGFKIKPSVIIEHGMWFEQSDGKGYHFQIGEGCSIDWQDSLEERPNE